MDVVYRYDHKFDLLANRTGQLLALRIDIFPADICRELSRLQSRALGFPGAMARAIVEEELGGAGLGYLEHCVAMEEVSRASASVGKISSPFGPTPRMNHGDTESAEV